MIPGLIFLLLPLGWIRLIGLFPITGSLLQWELRLRPKWKFIIKVDSSGLKIGDHLYEWKALTQFQVLSEGSRRTLCIGTLSNPKKISIKDDLPRFNELAQECFFYMNQTKTLQQTRQSTSNRRF